MPGRLVEPSGSTTNLPLRMSDADANSSEIAAIAGNSLLTPWCMSGIIRLCQSSPINLRPSSMSVKLLACLLTACGAVLACEAPADAAHAGGVVGWGRQVISSVQPGTRLTAVAA